MRREGLSRENVSVAAYGEGGPLFTAIHTDSLSGMLCDE